MQTRELAGLLVEMYDGNPWHGPSVVAALNGVNAASAATKPLAARHSIWEIVLHMTGWTREVHRRLGGATPGLPAGGDWPELTDTSNGAWRHALNNLGEAQRALVEAVSKESDEKWSEMVGRNRDAPLGTGVSYGVMLVGLISHHAYHAGQISLLK